MKTLAQIRAEHAEAQNTTALDLQDFHDGQLGSRQACLDAASELEKQKADALERLGSLYDAQINMMMARADEIAKDLGLPGATDQEQKAA